MPKFKLPDGETLSVEWLERQYLNRQTIPLIKAYRQVTGKGLKDSKDAIEECFTADMVIQLFKPYLLSDEEIAAAKQAQIELEEARKAQQEQRLQELEDEATKAILDGIECVCKNWRILGFPNKMKGCQAILRNLKYRIPRAP